jgi:acyl-CoA synthetase (AMP-forming)/AMP-acid ligase II
VQYKHLTDYLIANAKATPDKAALVFEGETLSWQQLWSRVDYTARALGRRLPDTDEQMVVSLLMPNSVDYVVAYLAIIHLGHIAMPLDVIYKKLEIEAQIRQIPSRFVIADKRNKPKAEAAGETFLLRDLAKGEDLPEPKLLRLQPDQQIASLVFTSGTTGTPKAVPHTHVNHLWNIIVCSRVWGWNHNDTLLLSLRLSHVYGLVMTLPGILYYGNTVYLQGLFDARDTLEWLSTGKISLFMHTPIGYAKMLEVPGDYDLSAVRLPISGSAPLPPSVWQAFKDRFRIEILEVYGSSETGRISSNLPDERRSGTPGYFLPEVQAKFSDIGELLIKSPGVFPGYFKNDQGTQENSVDGWWRTGDLGELQGDRLVLKGRLHEIIRKQGYTISPRDIEWAIHENPKVNEVSVLGVGGEDGADNQLLYFIVGDLTEDELLSYCHENLPSVWRPDKIIFLDEIPRTKNGKVELTTLKAMVN